MSKGKGKKSTKKDAKQGVQRGEVFIVCGPSGVGKSSIIRMALAQLKSTARLSVSATTRKKRDGEVNGVDYTFVKKKDFKNMIKADHFAEYAKVHGEYYGTLRQYVLRWLRRGRDMILDIDVQGFKQIKRCGIGDSKVGIHTIFVLPPNYGVLEQRLLGRGTSNNMELRLANAAREISHAYKFQHFIVNESDNSSAAVQRLLTIIRDVRKARREEFLLHRD